MGKDAKEMAMSIKEEIIRNRIVLIARGIDSTQICDAARAVYQGGGRFLEITLNQASSSAAEDTGALIRMVRDLGLPEFHVGAGTVITESQLESVYDSGAEFILSPNTDPLIIKRTKELGLTSVPGAYTPSEIQYAWACGADIVKVFPASIGGIPYVHAIRGPLNNIPLMAVGGINENNAKEYLANGYCSCGLGSNILRKDLIENGDYDSLTELVRRLISNTR